MTTVPPGNCSRDARAGSGRCPNDDGCLHPVSARSRLGQPIVLDQCDHCGGIWFDRFELFQVDEKEAAQLDSLDRATLDYPLGEHQEPRCPKCGQPLNIFTDPNLPANIQILICASCEGLWLNHGALAGYADFRLQGHPAPDPKLAEQYEKMLQDTSDRDKWNTLANLGHELGGPRDMLTGLPLDGTPEQLETIDRALDVAYAFIRTAARLLFHI